jgi:AcrR family transcriptional regulator
MSRNGETRQNIVNAATHVLLSENLAGINLQNICQRAGITKKSFYYHFESKDQLLETVVEGLQPFYAATFERWASEAGPKAHMGQRIASLFKALARESTRPGWKGCCFLQVAAVLGNLPGHPARKLAAQANGRLETWLATDLQRDGHPTPAATASHLLMLINGLIITLVVHRDTKYLAYVLKTAEQLVPIRGLTHGLLKMRTG